MWIMNKYVKQIIIHPIKILNEHQSNQINLPLLQW